MAFYTFTCGGSKRTEIRHERTNRSALDSSLLSRWSNWIYITEEKLLESLVYRPAQVRLFKMFFGYPAEKLDELRARFSVILVNSHFSMGRVRANVPNIIEVAGVHLSEPPEPCGAELQKYLDSMGQDILMEYLPENMMMMKQRVIWKSELSMLPNKSENVYVMDKMPQRMVLAHPNLRLIITHGGLQSVMEAIDNGVPMLGLPLFFDQFNNVHRVQLAGMAKVLDPNDLNADTFIETINELIENPSYAERAKAMALSFRDRPMSPLDTALWWTEYALRNRDTSYMRLNVEEIPLMRYYRLDSILTFGVRLGCVCASLIFLGWRLYQKNRNRHRRLQERERVLAQIQLRMSDNEVVS
ncbi:UDP-glucuronosyltransferase 2C1-like [Drosophila mauritiana]|uniref:UDP-glucuronosyltransferase 2C1-like n=1 Tax=Drosophila mauritiana TaxID=7226 RepID=A0A6P8KDM2_DROMA|nr:UDP-glucuronosyltransferase 2C1-like [Drosophila mauritiana]